jgi:retron-type reverse transcriptase
MNPSSEAVICSQRRKESRKAAPEEQWQIDWLPSTVPALLGHPQSSGLNERTGHLTMTQLNRTGMQDRLSWWNASVHPPVWRRSPNNTQRLPVMGLAASTRWISLGIRHGNMTENQKLRGRGTVLEALTINCEDTRMLSARTGDKLRAISEVARKGRKVKDLRRLMNHPDVWMQAYLNIQGNKGALTRGTDQTTMDGFSPERAANLVELIREKRYKPKPVRRAKIPTKVAGKKRPLGLPSADDKLVQEVVRLILERIYEPLFKDSSHGFRPKRSCHTALAPMTRTWTGTKWFIDIDIRGYFDNINRDILMKVLEKRIEDTQFLDLIRDMLKAGYVEDWQYHKTYSGTPQGGIVTLLTKLQTWC